VVLTGVGVWYSPISPVALYLADAKINTGEFEDIVQRYEQIARYHWSAPTRARALNRASLLYELNSQDVEGLHGLYELATTEGELADLEAQIGTLYVERGEHSKGAIWLERSQRSATDIPKAGPRLLMAARARFESGQMSKAEKLYLRVGRKYPSLNAEAEIGLAELLLSVGKARAALKHFEQAALHAEGAPLQALAQFGMATCLERMGNLDEALAEMDEIDLPERVLDERRDGIRAHQAAEYGGL
jgi:tetratricopeptide (TPR) repeat protein